MLSTAWADAVQRAPMIERNFRESLVKLRTSAGTDPETVWVGHVKTNTGHPGTAGGSGPFKIGRGDHHLVGGRLGTDAAYNGTWDFDRLAGSTDSLMAWWPIQCPFGSIGPNSGPRGR